MICSYNSLAQWSDDPNENIMVADSSYSYGEFRVNPYDSTYYMLYYNHVSDPLQNFMLYLQKYNFHGERQWGEKGIIVDDSPNREWISSIDLVFGEDKKIYVGYSAPSLGIDQDTNHIKLNAITTEGQKLWGDYGIDISTPGTLSDYGVKLTVTDENNILAAYEQTITSSILQSDISKLVLKQFSSDGNQQWEYEPPFSETEFLYDATLVHLQDEILCIYQHFDIDIIHDTLMRFAGTLKAQKFSEDGTTAFEEPKNVFTYSYYYNELPIFNYKLSANQDEGYFIGTYCSPSTSDNIQLYVQYIDIDAEPSYYPNPVEVSHYEGLDIVRADFSMATMKNNRSLYIMWVEGEGVGTEATHRIVGQLISEPGIRMWGQEGIELCPKTYQTEERYNYMNVKSDTEGNAMVFHMKWYLDDDNVDVIAQKINDDGNTVWPSDVKMSTMPFVGDGLYVTDAIEDKNSNTQWVATWEQLILDNNSQRLPSPKFGQNITPRGSIGTGIINNNKVNVSLTAYPNPATNFINLQLKSSENQTANIEIINTTGQVVLSKRYNATPTANNVQIDINSLTPGIYILKAKLKDGIGAIKIQVN